MFLSRLRLLNAVYQRTNVVQEIIRKSRIKFPAISVRTYAPLIEDDEYMTITKTSVTDSEPRERKSFDQQKPFKRRSNNKVKQSQRETSNDERPKTKRKTFNDRIQILSPLQFNPIELNHIRKDFYQPSEVTHNRISAVINEFRAKHEITVPSDAPKPIFTFNELENLPENVIAEIEKHNFHQCTPIQAQGMPIALSGKNMVGIAQTGSGKTLAYIVPAVLHILNQPPLQPGDGPIALVLAPTRELAKQIEKVAREYGESSGVRNIALYGGASKSNQIEDIGHGAELIVATPGRLIDLLSSTNLNLRRCSYLVIDEADRMLDMGFEPQMRQIVSQIRPNRQMLMWSATWPRVVRYLARDFLNNDYMQLTVGSTELCANHNIKQIVKVCEVDDKYEILFEILEDISQFLPSERKTLIFVRRKKIAEKMAKKLNQRGMNTEPIHSGLSQEQREQTLDAYRTNRIEVLVATDVASRGLDVSDIKHVINFHYPHSTEDYVHRIGRTGRSKSNGTAYTLFTKKDHTHAKSLIAVLEEAKQEVDPALIELSKSQPGIEKSFNHEIQKLKPIHFSRDKLSKIKKDFHQPSEVTQNRTDAEITEFRGKYVISVPSDAPKPIFTFNELENLPGNVIAEIEKHNFHQCTPIQAQGMPIALSGKNMVGIAQTGSGKTLAYILPAIAHILNQPPLQPGDGPIALILAPTRELAQQIEKVASEYGKSSGVRNTTSYGGIDRADQLTRIQCGVELIVATPGRLIDLLSSTSLNLRRCTYLVIDEADRMLDMGFEPQMSQIVSQIHPDRQTLMWSATWPRKVINLARDFLDDNYMQLTVGSTELCANHNIKQVVKVCDECKKYDVLFEILQDINKLEPSKRKTLIFVRTKNWAEQLANQLKQSGLNVEPIHGGLLQEQREQTLAAYRQNRINVLVATDVASRGLDVSDIKHVINFDYPNTTENYVHRIGRTGRSKLNGTAYTLFTEDNHAHAGDLIAVLREAKQKVDPALIELSEIQFKKKKKN